MQARLAAGGVDTRLVVKVICQFMKHVRFSPEIYQMNVHAIRGWVGWDGLGWDWISPGGVRCRAPDGANEYEIRFSPIICVDKAATGGGQGARASCEDSGGATCQTLRAGIPPEVLFPFHPLHPLTYMLFRASLCNTICSGSHTYSRQRATGTSRRPSNRTRPTSAPS